MAKEEADYFFSLSPSPNAIGWLQETIRTPDGETIHYADTQATEEEAWQNMKKIAENHLSSVVNKREEKIKISVDKK